MGCVFAVAVSTWGASTDLGATTLRIAHNLGQGGRESLDPISPTRFFEANQLLYGALIRPDRTGLPSPELAVAWSASNEFKEWTLTLREGVTFHDGKPFRAEDAAYSLQRILSPKIASPVRSVLAIMDNVAVVDKKTIKITLKAGHADFPLILMDYRVRMVSGHGREDKLDDLNTTGVGTGPFKLVELKAESTTKLVANPDYWEGKPGVGAVEIIAIPDSDARVQALLAGQIDLARGVNARQRQLFAGRPQFTVQVVPTGSWNPLIMRTDKPPFTDKRVRKALRLLADRKAIADTMFGPQGAVIGCDAPVWPGDPYYFDLACQQDIASAKALLAEAGFPNGLELDLYTSDVNSNMVQLAQIYQAQAAKAGVKINLKMAPADGYWKTVWLQQPFVAGNWGQRPADQILNEAFRSGAKWNESYLADSELDALMDKARSEPDLAKRKAVYAQIQKRLYEEGGTFIPFFYNDARAFSSKVSNVEPVYDLFLPWHRITKSE
jgi:peptide/nickel transport system substrate-binding protein